MRKKEKISDFKKVREIIRGEGSFALDGIKINFNSRIPLFFHMHKLPSSVVIAKDKYQEAEDYIENILDKHSEYYDARSVINGSYRFSGKDIQKHFIHFEQFLEKPGIGERIESKVLDVSISFQMH